MNIDIMNDEYWEHLNRTAQSIKENWNQRVLRAIGLEKKMGEQYYKEIRLAHVEEDAERIRAVIGTGNVYPWKRDKHGNPIYREPKASCQVCDQPVYDNIQSDREVICGKCLQVLCYQAEQQGESYDRETYLNQIFRRVEREEDREVSDIDSGRIRMAKTTSKNDLNGLETKKYEEHFQTAIYTGVKTTKNTKEVLTYGN